MEGSDGVERGVIRTDPSARPGQRMVDPFACPGAARLPQDGPAGPRGGRTTDPQGSCRSSPRTAPGWVRPDCHPGAKADVLEHRVVSLTQRRLTDPAAVIAGLPPDSRRTNAPCLRWPATTSCSSTVPSHQEFLAEILLAECDDRDRRSSLRRVKSTNFPRDKWLGDFD